MQNDTRTPLSVLTKETLIPVSLAISLGVGVWSLATMNAKISNNEVSIAELKVVCLNNPNRAEFDNMKDDIKEIKSDVKKLITNN